MAIDIVKNVKNGLVKKISIVKDVKSVPRKMVLHINTVIYANDV